MFDREGRLAATLADRPGPFAFTQPLPPGGEEPALPYGTLQCFLREHEPTLLGLACRVECVEDLLDGLERLRFRVVDGPPRPVRFARL